MAHTKKTPKGTDQEIGVGVTIASGDLRQLKVMLDRVSKELTFNGLFESALLAGAAAESVADAIRCQEFNDQQAENHPDMGQNGCVNGSVH